MKSRGQPAKRGHLGPNLHLKRLYKARNLLANCFSLLPPEAERAAVQVCQCVFNGGLHFGWQTLVGGCGLPGTAALLVGGAGDGLPQQRHLLRQPAARPKAGRSRAKQKRGRLAPGQHLPEKRLRLHPG